MTMTDARCELCGMTDAAPVAGVVSPEPINRGPESAKPLAGFPPKVPANRCQLCYVKSDDCHPVASFSVYWDGILVFDRAACRRCVEDLLTRENEKCALVRRLDEAVGSKDLAHGIVNFMRHGLSGLSDDELRAIADITATPATNSTSTPIPEKEGC